MATARAQSIRLRPETYKSLEDEAERRHIGPDELADQLVREELERTQVRRAQMREALDALKEFSKGMPEVVAVQLVREGREDLERRGTRWLSS